jgi:methylisocitrate lyase
VTTTMQESPGSRFRLALRAEVPLQVAGAINANHALLAQRAGFRAVYLSGGGVAAGSLGLPDLGISTLDDVLTDVRRITDVCDLPLLVDADTGFGATAFNISRTTRALIKFGAAGMHLEDQALAKRCGHRPNKRVVPKEEMLGRLKAVLDARTDESFFIIARTDALSTEGLALTLDRAVSYAEAGVDAIFPEAVASLDTYKRFADTVNVPILANSTEFGVAPLFTVQDLAGAKVGMVLYPLSAFRAMNKAAENVYNAIRRDGTQQNVIGAMQTRAELYEVIGYDAFEEKLDAVMGEANPAHSRGTANAFSGKEPAKT